MKDLRTKCALFPYTKGVPTIFLWLWFSWGIKKNVQTSLNMGTKHLQTTQLHIFAFNSHACSKCKPEGCCDKQKLSVLHSGGHVGTHP